MPPDFVPEKAGEPAVLVRPDRDFIPEGGFTPEEASIKRKEGERPPPGMAPLRDRDFIHEIVIPKPTEEEKAAGRELPPKERGVAKTTEKRTSEDDRLERLDEARQKELIEETIGKPPERPPVPAPEERAASEETPLDVPPGYEFRGYDDEGQPIIRRKSGRLTNEEKAAFEKWKTEQEAGQKGGEVRAGRRPGRKNPYEGIFDE